MPSPLNSSKINKPLKRSKNLFPVVGIGASAGGLAAFKALLKAIPKDSGMAYVLVQHLDPNHESLLPELLQKCTKIPILEITDEVVVEPDHVYIIPSNKTLISNNGKLELGLREDRNKSQKHFPIDIFFESLAEVHQSHTIGIVLSGNGNDGTMGLKAIKEVGGITFSQDLDSAQYTDMPKNAFQEGVVDFMLAPEDIPKRILEINRRIYDSDGKEKELENDNSEIFKQILALLKVRKGTDFTFYKQTTIRRRILRRMALSNKEEPSEYLQLLRENKTEQDVLHQDLLIPVSSFFRDPEIFKTVCKSILPRILEKKSNGESVRFWVAGCSTGQEVYTLAMCLLDILEGREEKEKIQIFGTDISEKAITKARAGIYTTRELNNLTEDRLRKFFSRVDGKYQINKNVREMCVFACHNS